MGHEAFTERKTENYRGSATFFSGFDTWEPIYVLDGSISIGDTTGTDASIDGAGNIIGNSAIIGGEIVISEYGITIDNRGAGISAFFNTLDDGSGNSYLGTNNPAYFGDYSQTQINTNGIIYVLSDNISIGDNSGSIAYIDGGGNSMVTCLNASAGVFAAYNTLDDGEGNSHLALWNPAYFGLYNQTQINPEGTIYLLSNTISIGDNLGTNAYIDGVGNSMVLSLTALEYVSTTYNTLDDGEGNSILAVVHPAYFGAETQTQINTNGLIYVLNDAISIGDASGSVAWINYDGSASFSGGNLIIESGGGIISSDAGSFHGGAITLGSSGGYAAYIDTSGHARFFGSLETTYNILDDGTGNARINNGLTIYGGITVSSGVAGFAGGSFIDGSGNISGKSISAPYMIVSSTTTLTASSNVLTENRIAANTSSNAITINLPHSTTINAGQTVDIIDATGTWATHNLTVAPYSGDKINGSTSSITYSTPAHLIFVYINSTYGWRQS